MYPDRVSKGDKVGEILFESEKLTAAYNLASKSHEGQKRHSGEPYFNHCVAVLKILEQEWGIQDENTLAAGILHDAVEDSSITIEQVREEFGDEVAEIVEGVTKLETGTDQQTLAKVLKKTHLNPKVAIVKLADRLHNMRTLEFMSPEKQIEKSTETLDVYTKLAESLGIWKVKRDLEDLCFKYIDPEGYQKIVDEVDSDQRLNSLFTSYVSSDLRQLMEASGVEGTIELRKNGYWALKEKRVKMAMGEEGNPDSFENINDLLSIRVVVKSREECRQLLGVIHDNRGVQIDFERFDEFIGDNARVNGYEALQTTMKFPQGPVEIAIVTKEMEDFNNWGIIDKINKGNTDLKDYNLKFVFTPAGRLRFLPEKATGVDFALTINRQLLINAQRIMFVDGEPVDISAIIPNASLVKIVTGESRLAPLKFLEDYCLPTTRDEILRLRSVERRGDWVEQGKILMEEILAPRGLLVLEDIDDRAKQIYFTFGANNENYFYFLLGYGTISAKDVNLALDEAKITKQELGLTSVRLAGNDQVGILEAVTQRIKEMGKNIVSTDQKTRGGIFNIRITVAGMTAEQEALLIECLGQDDRFSSYRIV
ncbi:MAG: HD domain-containing protein [Microgenomates group bacterium]